MPGISVRAATEAGAGRTLHPGTDRLCHWTFDQTSGPTVTNQVGGGPNGTVVGTVGFVPGVTGNAADLTTAGGYVTFGDNYDMAGDYTLAFWFKVVAADDYSATSGMAVAGKHHTGFFNGYFAGVNAGSGYGAVNKAYHYTGAAPVNSPVSTTSVNDGNWYHFAGVKSGSTAYIYIDGALEGTAASGSAAGNLAAFMAGALWNGSSNFDSFDGLIDDLRIYDHALSQSEIETVMSAVPEPGTIALTLAGLGLLAWKRRF